MAEGILGRWVDEQGRILVVENRHAGRLTASMYKADGKTAFERALRSPVSPTLDMPAVVEEGKLLIELGSPGVGPLLQLERSKGEGPDQDFLFPRLKPGLDFDFEDDLGVPWIFPLSAFRRQSVESR